MALTSSSQSPASRQYADVSGINGPPSLAFVTLTGPPSKKSNAMQRLVRSHAMRQVGKSRRKGRPVKKPLLGFEVEVPDQRFWDGVHSSWPMQEDFLGQPAVEWPDDFPGERQDAEQSVSSFDASQFLPDIIDGSYQSIIPYTQNRVTMPESNSTENEPLHTGDHLPPIQRLWAGRYDPFARYPIEMNFRAHELIDHIFDDSQPHFKPFREAWFPIAMLSPAAFHQVLANSAFNISQLRDMGRAPESFEAVKHHTYAVKLVNERMEEPGWAVSDEVVGAVVAFVCYFNITGNVKNWRIHMKGLKEIARLRGGPDSGTFNQIVRMMLSWADIFGSSNQDIRPTFPLPTFISQTPTYPTTTTIDLPLLIAQTSLAWRVLLCDPAPLSSSSDTTIINILDSLSLLTTFLKSESIRTQGAIYQNADFAARYVNPILHRLLSLSPSTISANGMGLDVDVDGSHGDRVVEEAARLACILYLAEIRRNFGILPVTSTIQVSKLRNLHPLSSTSTWTSFPALHIWILAMGVVESHLSSQSAVEESQRAWFVRQLCDAARAYGYETDIDQVVQNILKQFLWIDDLHGVRFWRNFDLGTDGVVMEEVV